GFILNELLPKYDVIEIKKFTKDIITAISSHLINKNIFVFTSNIHNYDEIYNIVSYLKPKIIIHLSDEWGNKAQFQNLANYCQLLIRQHNHNYSVCSDATNIMYMPLGYMDKMFEHTSLDLTLKLPKERKYNWSF